MPINLPRLEAVPEAGLFACVEYEGEDRVLYHCPMNADGTPDTDSYGPVDLDACEKSTLVAIDEVLGTEYADPPVRVPLTSRVIREHRVYGRSVDVEAQTEKEARSKASTGGVHAWEAKETEPGKWTCFVAKHEDCFALND